MDDDSEYSDNDIDVEDGIKLVKALPTEINRIEYEEKAVEDSLWYQTWKSTGQSKSFGVLSGFSWVINV